MTGPAQTKLGAGAVFVLGAGPVAKTLAAGLAASGRPPVGLWARRSEAAEEAGAFAGVPAFGSAPWPESMRAADTLLLAVRDDAITPLAERLASEGVLNGRQVLLHCAGSRAAEHVFANLPARGYGLLHPLRAIVDPAAAVRVLAQTTFGVEGDPAGQAVAQGLCDSLGAPSLVLRAEQMAAYHAAASIASNYLVSLIDLAHEVLESAGIEGAGAHSAFADLAQGALDNLRREGLPGALSGPIRRGDRQTVAAHLGALEQGPAENAQLYRQLALRAVGLSRQLGGAQASELDEIARLLMATAEVDPQTE